jgi:hypothetical protein
MKKKNNNKPNKEKKITRKEAIKKTGISALTAASIMFLSTKESAAASTNPTPPGSGW